MDVSPPPGGAVPEIAPTAGLVRQRMSYADYLALPEQLRAEWVDGEVVVSPSPTYGHQQIARRLANVLEASLPTMHVVEAVTVRLPNSRERVPDVIVLAAEPEGDHITDVPVVTVEVLSPSTRSEDTVRKSTEYLAAGVQQYWVVDPQNRVLDVFENVSGGWEPLAHLDDDAPHARVEVAPYGVVELGLAAAFG